MTELYLSNLQLNFLDGYQTEYEQKIVELTEKYQDEFAKANSAQSCIDELRDQLNESRQEVTKMTESLKRYETEILEYRKDRNGVVDERDSLMKMVERRNFEVERIESDIKSLKQQLQAAINSKCEALSKYDEVQQKEVNIDFKVSTERANLNKVLQFMSDFRRKDSNRSVFCFKTKSTCSPLISTVTFKSFKSAAPTPPPEQ